MQDRLFGPAFRLFFTVFPVSFWTKVRPNVYYLFYCPCRNIHSLFPFICSVFLSDVACIFIRPESIYPFENKKEKPRCHQTPRGTHILALLQGSVAAANAAFVRNVNAGNLFFIKSFRFRIIILCGFSVVFRFCISICCIFCVFLTFPLFSEILCHINSNGPSDSFRNTCCNSSRNAPANDRN